MTVLAHGWPSLLSWWHSIHWDPNWVGAIGQWAGAIGTVAAVIVALWLPRWERRKEAAERLKQRRERQRDNARLVTIAIPEDEKPYLYIEIYNGSDLPVHRPRIDSVVDPRVQFNPDTRPFRYKGRGSFHPDVLRSGKAHEVLYKYRISDDNEVEHPMTATDVTITFIDADGQRWRRTGSGEPERI